MPYEHAMCPRGPFSLFPAIKKTDTWKWARNIEIHTGRPVRAIFSVLLLAYSKIGNRAVILLAGSKKSQARNEVLDFTTKPAGTGL